MTVTTADGMFSRPAVATSPRPVSVLSIAEHPPHSPHHSELACPEVAHMPTLEKDESHGSSVHSYPDRDRDQYETDVEAMMPNRSRPLSRKYNICSRQGGDCAVWPGQEHWRQRARAAKIKRSCTCLALLSQRNRIIVKVFLVVLVIGIAVGVGVGISKPLGAPMWGTNRPA